VIRDIDVQNLSRSGFMYPIKVEDQQNINVSKGTYGSNTCSNWGFYAY
jgi:hypothetical protein